MNIQPDSNPSNHPLSELSNDELDAISGGQVNVSFTLMMAEDTSAFASEDCGNSSSFSGYRRRSFFGLEINGTFASMDHFSSFLSKITDFFGRR
jgi:bacteriocin-like protein